MATQTLLLIERPLTRDLHIPMSFEEFVDLPHNLHAEWVDGEAIIFMTTTEVHARVIAFLVRLVGGFAEERGLGEVLTAPYGMRVRGGKSFREPDLMYIRSEHRHQVVGIAVDGPADLVVEIVSQGSPARDRAEKFDEYHMVGVPEYWLYDSRPGKERIDVFALGPDGRYEPITKDADGRYHSRVLRGFWLRLDWLRADPLPPVKTVLAAILALIPEPESDRGAV